MKRAMINSIWEKSIDEWTSYGSEEERPKFKPTRKQIDDCLTVLGWCAPLDKESFQIVWLRSHDLSFTKIADIVRISYTAKQAPNIINTIDAIIADVPRGDLCAFCKVNEAWPTMRLPENLPTKKAFTDRVLNACKTIRVLRDPEVAFQGYRPLVGRPVDKLPPRPNLRKNSAFIRHGWRGVLKWVRHWVFCQQATFYSNFNEMWRTRFRLTTIRRLPQGALRGYGRG